MSPNKNARLALSLAALAIAMIGLSFAAVPLYDLFCRKTGFGGTTQRAAAAPAQAGQNRTQNRIVTVSLNADVAPDLPWDFKPEINAMPVRIGETATVRFRARNISGKALVGTAVYNVQPDKAGVYFNKLQCFCFMEQVLQPGETAELPVNFFIDPDMVYDKKLDDVQAITLSYTFFLAKDQRKAFMPPVSKSGPAKTR